MKPRVITSKDRNIRDRQVEIESIKHIRRENIEFDHIGDIAVDAVLALKISTSCTVYFRPDSN